MGLSLSSLNPFLSAAATSLAAKAGVDIGASSPQATKPPAVGGVASQPPQAQFITGNQWFQKPIVIIGAAVAVVALLWALRGKK